MLVELQLCPRPAPWMAVKQWRATLKESGSPLIGGEAAVSLCGISLTEGQGNQGWLLGSSLM